MAMPRVVLISDDSSVTEKVVQRLNAGGLTVQVLIDSPTEIAMRLPGSEAVVVVLVQQTSNMVPVGEILHQIQKVNPVSETVFIQKYVDHATTRELVRGGVADIMRYPEEIDQLEAMVRHAIRILKNKEWEKGRMVQAGMGRETGKIFCFYSAKGGSGKTLLAANLAQAIQLKSNRKVLLVDFNLQFGGIQSALNIRHGRSLTELIPVIYELDLAQIENISVTLESSGMQILLGPNDLEAAESIGMDFVDILLKTCRRYFDYIVVDLPSHLNPVSMAGITQADKVLYVMAPDTPSIEAMKRALEIFQHYGISSEKKLAMVVNRLSRQCDITLKDIERISPMEIAGAIRSDYRAIQGLVNMGKPLLENQKDKGKSKLAKDILALAQHLTA